MFDLRNIDRRDEGTQIFGSESNERKVKDFTHSFLMVDNNNSA